MADELLKAIRNDIAGIKTAQDVTNLRLSAIEDMLQADFTSRLAQRDQITALINRVAKLEALVGVKP